MKRVLDLGCWNGALVKELKNEYDIYGADINTARFDNSIKDRLFYLDITKEVPNIKPFDAIIMSEVLEHLDNDVIALKNIAKLLNKDGILYLTTPNSIPSFEYWDPAWIRWKLNLGGKHYHYSIEELLSKLNSCGFAIERIRLNGNMKWLFCRWFNLPLKHIFKLKKLLSTNVSKGYFDWEIIARKK